MREAGRVFDGNAGRTDVAPVAFRRDGQNEISAKHQRHGGAAAGQDAARGAQPPPITGLIAAVAQRPRSVVD